MHFRQGRGLLCLREDQVTNYMELIKDARARAAQASTSSADLGRLAIVKTESGIYLLTDGFHRYEAYKRLNITDIPVLVYQGTRDDALLLACVLNAQRGLPYGLADRGKVAETYIEAYLRRYPDVPLPTDSEIGRRLGISRSTVTRAALAVAEQVPLPPSRLVQRGSQQFEMKPATRTTIDGYDPLFFDPDDAFASQPTPPQMSPGTRRTAQTRRSPVPQASRPHGSFVAQSELTQHPHPEMQTEVPIDVDRQTTGEIAGQITWITHSEAGEILHGTTPFNRLHELPSRVQVWLAHTLTRLAKPL